MTNLRLHSEATDLRQRPTGHVAPRRPIRMKGFAAAFSVFALYLAWHAPNDGEGGTADEMPMSAAQAQGAS
ncbi:hypothetical protein, partial [Oceanospirillum multiglobuliferum]